MPASPLDLVLKRSYNRRDLQRLAQRARLRGTAPAISPAQRADAMKIRRVSGQTTLRDAAVAVPVGQVAGSADEAAGAFLQKLGSPVAVVKAQIHAGGRGKGTVNTNPQQRGVQLVRSAEEAAEVAGRLLGQPLVTIQTGPEGRVVRQVLVEEGCDIAASCIWACGRSRGRGPVLVMSSEGGMDIEHVAAHTPERIFKEPFGPMLACKAFKSASWPRIWG